MERFEVAASAATIVGERHGDSGPALVALHAGVADRRAWRPVAERLAGTATVIAYDRRGFGDTVAPPEDHSHVEDLAAVITAQAEAEPVWLLGSSQGGRIALDFTLVNPGRVVGLVLVSPAITGAPEPDLSPAELAVAEALDAAEEDEDVDAVNRIEAHVWLDGAGSAEGRVGDPARALFLDMNGRALAAPDPGEADEPHDAMERLAEIEVPALVIWGDLDLTGVCARSAWLADELPTGRAVVVPGTAHLPYLERPDEFAALVVDVISRRTPRGAATPRPS